MALVVLFAGLVLSSPARPAGPPPDTVDPANGPAAAGGTPPDAPEGETEAPAQIPAVRIELSGLPDDISAAILPNLSIQQAAAAEFAGGENDVRYLHRQSRKQLARALRSFGYYHATVSGQLLQEGEHWIASYQVEPGLPVHFSEVMLELKGDADAEPALAQRVHEFPIRVGDILNHERYEQAKRALLREVHDRGYLNAELIRHRITVDLDRNQARLDLAIESGPLFRFGEVTLVQDFLDPQFVQRYVDIEPGERYSVRRLLDLERALRNTEFFRSVSVQPEVEQADADGHVPIQVVLEPNKRDRYTFGLGFGTDTGPRGQAGWRRRWVNRSGHGFFSEVILSQVDGAFDNRYIIPLDNPRHDELILSGGYRNNNPDTYDSKIGYAGIDRSELRGRTRVNYFLSYQHEDYTVADEGGIVDMLIPGISMTRVETDDRLKTRKGNRVDITLQGGPDIAFFDVRFLQLRAFGKLILPLGDRARLITRGEIGLTLAPDLDELPASLRFFTGGDRTVRGYDYESLGPRNEEGEVTGGRHLAVGSMELDFEVAEKWRVAAFIDAGNAFDDRNEPLARGTGLGVRYQTPVGPVRVDVANAISDPDRPWRVHITFGPEL